MATLAKSRIKRHGDCMTRGIERTESVVPRIAPAYHARKVAPCAARIKHGKTLRGAAQTEPTGYDGTKLKRRHAAGTKLSSREHVEAQQSVQVVIRNGLPIEPFVSKVLQTHLVE